jgi:hypothetical protein
VVEEPVTGLVTASEPLVGAVVSVGTGRRPPRFDTKIRPCFAEYVTANGAIPTGTCLRIVFVSASITATEFDRLMAMYAVLPSAENAMPAGTGCPWRVTRCDSAGLPDSDSAVMRRSSPPLRPVSPVQISRSPGRNATPV